MSWVTDMNNFLDGQRTNILCAAAFVVKILGATGVMDKATADEIVAWMIPGIAMTMRSAIKKLGV